MRNDERVKTADLYQKSIEIIKANQHPSGSYVASPNFPPYNYCWLRDGTFIAYAMDLAGEHESAANFYSWVDRTIQRYGWKVENISARLKSGKPLDLGNFLHTRYTLEGYEAEGEWENFQLDGYGTWLWGLYQHIKLAEDFSLWERFKRSAEVTLYYLSLLWDRPSYDCWEENVDKIHISTLSSIYGGIRCLSDAFGDSGLVSLAESIKQFVLQKGVRNGHLVKHVGSTAVDASLIWATTPFGLVAPQDSLTRETVRKTERDLLRGGVHRYADDTYYGGGQWILLTAWLGWYYTEVGKMSRAGELLRWVEAQADLDGNLPEQVSTKMLHPEHYQKWVRKWGPVACPLLWSHAMYIVLYSKLGSGR